MPRHFPADIDPTAIGRVSAPPFAIVPDPAEIFATRAQRLRHLADFSDLKPYLTFLAGLAEAQDAVQARLPGPAAIASEALERARLHAMPPLDRAGFAVDATVAATLDALFDAAQAIDKPPAAASALDRVREADAAARAAMVANVLADSFPVESVAEHVFVAAALQVHWARLAARLDPKSLVAIGDTLCPACGGPPVASMVVGWPGSENIRFCACPLCATLWHSVRIKCTACGSTKGIGYQGIEGDAGLVRAETCDACGSYTKLMQQNRDPAIEPLADDIASLGLDLLMREGRYRRAAFNPFLLGY